MARQARAEVTRGKIIDAAVELFTDSGYGDTDLAAIVRRAGITKGAFYYHFESKEQVADAIVAEGNIRLRNVFSDADESSSSALFVTVSVVLIKPKICKSTSSSTPLGVLNFGRLSVPLQSVSV